VHIDKTYTPLHAEFVHVMSKYFPGEVMTGEQCRTLETMFFAGAAASYQILTETPEKKQTVFDEILDHADQVQTSA